MGKQYIKWFAKLALFIIVFIVTDFIFGMSIKTLDKRAVELNPDANKTSYLLNYVNSDILIVGASEVEFSYRPDIIMDSLGMSVYNCGQNGQRLYYQTTIVNSIIDRYSPRLLVWSVSPDYFTPHQGDFDKASVFKPYYHENLHCKQLLQKRSWYEKYKMASFYYTYNSEFHNYIINAIKPVKTNTICGYKKIAKSENTPTLEEAHWKNSPDELCIKLFENTICRLKEKEIQTVFVFSPNYSYGDYHNLDSYIIMKNIIESNGYVIMEDYYHYPKLMHACYFKDKDHLKEDAVVIFSKMMGHELKSLLGHENMIVNENYSEQEDSF